MPTRSILAAVAVLVPACSTPQEEFTQQTYLKASNTDTGDDFGRVIALSADGTILAVGAFREDSPADGVNQSDANEAADTRIGNFGAVYVFVRTDAEWSQEAYLKASNSELDDWFGQSLAISADGTTLAVGAPGEDSGSIDAQSSNAAESSGAVYVFTRAAGTWTQEAYLKAARPALFDNFGASVALSGDGSLLAIGVPEATSGSGAVHIFTRANAAWTPRQQLTGSAGGFGKRLALSLDGATLAAGAPGEEVGEVAGAGAVHVFARTNDTWARQTRVVAPDPRSDDEFGATLAISENGATLAVGAPREVSATDGGVGGSDTPTGAVHLFSRDGTAWNAADHLALASGDAGNLFGLSIALSPDATNLAIGAPTEPRSADHEVPDSCAGSLGGTVYRFAKLGATWGARTSIQGSNTCKDDYFGQAVGLSRDGSILAVGANGEDSAAHGIDQDKDDNSAHDAGAVYVLYD